MSQYFMYVQRNCHKVLCRCALPKSHEKMETATASNETEKDIQWQNDTQRSDIADNKIRERANKRFGHLNVNGRMPYYVSFCWDFDPDSMWLLNIPWHFFSSLYFRRITDWILSHCLCMPSLSSSPDLWHFHLRGQIWKSSVGHSIQKVNTFCPPSDSVRGQEPCQGGAANELPSHNSRPCLTTPLNRIAEVFHHNRENDGTLIRGCPQASKVWWNDFSKIHLHKNNISCYTKMGLAPVWQRQWSIGSQAKSVIIAVAYAVCWYSH